MSRLRFIPNQVRDSSPHSDSDSDSPGDRVRVWGTILPVGGQPRLAEFWVKRLVPPQADRLLRSCGATTNGFERTRFVVCPQAAGKGGGQGHTSSFSSYFSGLEEEKEEEEEEDRFVGGQPRRAE